MIKIVCVKKPEVSYTLLEGKTYEVGRKEGDITFPDDQSISRHHGQIIVDHPIANVTNAALIPNVCVTDLGSKFGTFVNDGIEKKTALSTREKMNLSTGDRFKFGLQWNEFRIEYTPLITTSSAVREIQKLKKDICRLGAHLLPEWTDKCEYVVMESITLTIKAVCALLSGKRIVTPAYFKDLLECYVTDKPNLPNPTDFLPELAEKALKDHNVSFEPNPKRSKLFEGKIFMFVNSKHLKKLSMAVESGGGTTCLITSALKDELKSPDSLLMSLAVDNSTLEKSTLQTIEDYKRSGKRPIPESEIGLAALHCSTAKFCNPHYDLHKATFPAPRMISQTQSSSNSSFKAVPETQDMVTQRSIGSDSIDVVDETLVNTSSDRKSSSSSVDDISFDNRNPGPSRRFQNTKKRQDDDIQELPNSKRRLPQGTETFLEPSIKKSRKEPITSNKTLSSLFDSSSDEDDVPAKVEEKLIDTNRTETMDVDQEKQAKIVNAKIEAHSINVEASVDIDVVPSTPATLDRVIKPAPLTYNSQEDLFPTDVSVKDIPSVSTKRKLEEDEVPKTRAKTRKVNIESHQESIQEKIKKLDISNTTVAAKSENGNSSEVDSDEVIVACPTIFVKQVLIERQPPGAESSTSRENVVNYKRFKKVTPLNSSFRANSLREDSVSIRLILDGEENCSFSSFSRNTEKDNTNSVMDTNQDQTGLFEDTSVLTAQTEPEPSTSRRTTRSSVVSPTKPTSSRASKAASAAVKPVDESQMDFERHVEGGARLTRSRRANVPDSPPKPPPKKKQTEIQDMWSF